MELGVKLQAFDCSETTDTISQGMVIRVCLEPNPEAIADGFRMKYIEYFKYVKNATEVGGDDGITQDAVVDRVEASNGFSRLTCDRGSTQCSVETLLLGSFYAGTGTVDAYGLATMQFGDQSTDDALPAGSRRSLQEQTDEVQQEFEIPFQLTPSDGQGATSTASSWFDEQSNNGGPNIANIGITILLVLNMASLLVLMFQHSFFKGMWMYLEDG